MSLQQEKQKPHGTHFLCLTRLTHRMQTGCPYCLHFFIAMPGGWGIFLYYVEIVGSSSDAKGDQPAETGEATDDCSLRTKPSLCCC